MANQFHGYIGTTEDVLRCMFGAQQHDAHVQRRKHWAHNQLWKQRMDAFERAAKEHLEEVRRRYANR